MWQPYLRVIRERCSQAIHILDRFHIVAKMNAALNDVRAAEGAPAGSGRLVEPILKKACWCVLKRKANLTELQRFRLRDLPALQPADRPGLSAEGGLPAILGSMTSPSWAGKFLDEWCRQVMRSRIGADEEDRQGRYARGTVRPPPPPPLILNYFRAKKAFSSGIVEGLNNKAKLTMRKSYGFRTFHVTETALYHALGKLPEPDVAHRFF